MNRRALPVIAGALVVGALIDVPFGQQAFPGYAALLGLFGCIALILGAKKVLAPLIDRDEDHYPADAPPDVQRDVWGAVVDPDAGDPDARDPDAGARPDQEGPHG